MSITARVRCVRCDVELAQLEAADFRELAFEFGSLILLCHSAVPHTSHELSYELDGMLAEHPPMSPDLTIECTHEHCGGPRSRTWPSVPLELVGMFTILFHTAHEGHRLRVRYGVKTWESPGPVHPEDDA